MKLLPILLLLPFFIILKKNYNTSKSINKNLMIKSDTTSKVSKNIITLVKICFFLLKIDTSWCNEMKYTFILMNYMEFKKNI